MHCDCCDKLLSKAESVTQYVRKNKDEPVRYSNMCFGCIRETFPPGTVVTPGHAFDEEESDDYFENESQENYDFGEEDE